MQPPRPPARRTRAAPEHPSLPPPVTLLPLRGEGLPRCLPTTRPPQPPQPQTGHFLLTRSGWMGGSEPSGESGVLARPPASHPLSTGPSCHPRLTGLLPIPIRPHPHPTHTGLRQEAGPGVCWEHREKRPTPSSHPHAGASGQPSRGSRRAAARPPGHTWDQPSQKSPQGPGLHLGPF